MISNWHHAVHSTPIHAILSSYIKKIGRCVVKNPETPHKKPRCSYISKIGSRCHADPEPGKRNCFFHHPARKTKKAEARRQAGEARSQQTKTETTHPRPPDRS